MKENKTPELDVVGFGALNMDQLHVVDKIAGPDDESFITGYSEFCGGSAANTIIGISRLGLNTGFIGKLGLDREGQVLLKNLQNENVDAAGILLSSDGRSGRVMGFVDKQGQRALYVDPGVNDQISIDDLDLSYLRNARVLHLTSFVGDSSQAQLDLINEIQENTLISLDPGQIYAERGMAFLSNFLQHTNILLINEIELKLLLGPDFRSYDQGAEYLLNEGIETVVVKRGDNGSYAINEEFKITTPCFDVHCIDTTGAGDAFNAGFLYAFIKDYGLEEACKFANFVASKCVQCKGATTGLPTTSSLKGDVFNLKK